MKYITLFLFLLSCATSNKTYVCGERECIDKREFKEYFAENLIIEVRNKKLKKNRSEDLVQLNTENSTQPKKKKINRKKEKKIKKIKEREARKAQIMRLKNERKEKKIQDKNILIEKKKLAKIKKNNKKQDIIQNMKDTKKEKPLIENVKIKTDQIDLKEIKKNNPNGNTNLKNKANICNEIKNCDIDKIAELLIKKGKEKEYPDITSK